MAATLKLVSVLVICILVTAPLTTNAITCDQVASTLTGCTDYLRTAGGSPPISCCNGLKYLFVAATTTEDRQTACSCLKSAAKSIHGINMDTAVGLLSQCGVNAPYKISLSTDCSTVS